MIAVWVAAALLPAAGEAQLSEVERRLGVMGTELRLQVWAADRPQALAASEVALRALEAAAERLSTWGDGGELARLNHSPAGEEQALSPELDRELAAARRCWEETAGAFDPAIAALVAAWGLRAGGAIPSPERLVAARAASGFQALSLGTDGGASWLRPGVGIEEGGFGKGAGIDAALTALARDGQARQALLDLGGQLAIYGEGMKARISLADPRDRQRSVLGLAIDRGSVSTSGNSERGLMVGGRKIGHLLDPRTGEPAPDFGSLAVWSEEALRADCLSTGLYVLGPEGALTFAAGHPDVEVVVVEALHQGLRVRASAGLRGRLTPLVPDLVIEFEQEVLSDASGRRDRPLQAGSKKAESSGG